jgi:hypothetical protein
LRMLASGMELPLGSESLGGLPVLACCMALVPCL